MAEGNTNNDNAELKPQLQSIFADIESNLPTIDFDISDVSRLTYYDRKYYPGLFSVTSIPIVASYATVGNLLAPNNRNNCLLTFH